MSVHMPRLPRQVEVDPRHRAVAALLAASLEPVWPGGTATMAAVPLADPLAAALVAARRAGWVQRGLETVARTLESEAQGLAAAGLDTRARVARVLVVSADGSVRFYRQVERVLVEHGGRVLGLRLQCDAATLGRLLFGAAVAAKAVGITNKDAVARVLLALAS